MNAPSADTRASALSKTGTVTTRVIALTARTTGWIPLTRMNANGVKICSGDMTKQRGGSSNSSAYGWEVRGLAPIGLRLTLLGGGLPSSSHLAGWAQVHTLYRRCCMARAIGKMWSEYHNGKRVRCSLFIWDDGKVDPRKDEDSKESYEQLRRLLDV